MTESMLVTGATGTVGRHVVAALSDRDVAMRIGVRDPKRSRTELTLREASDGDAPVDPDRLVLFKVTDVPATHEKLLEAGYDVIYGRRLFMNQAETIVTRDPTRLGDRDYYTVAYAERKESSERLSLFE